MLVAHMGATWQAKRDTAREPGKSEADWQLISAAGAPGATFTMRGTHQDGVEYRALDVVTKDYGWFAARKHNPGPCPGPDWQSGPVGKKGEKGVRGDRGEKGGPGRDALEWVGVKVDAPNYALIAVMSDGSEGPAIPLRALFEQFQLEAR
jgi:hypothetical protein